MPASSLRIPFDKLWKSITTEHFTDFLAMFLPDLYEQIYFAVKFSFLEQELESVIVNKNLRKADKLVGVHLKNGEEKWVYVHIEFENSANTNIKERMYNYHTCIKEKYGQEITAIVSLFSCPNSYNFPKIWKNNIELISPTPKKLTICLIQPTEHAVLLMPC